MVIKLVGTYIFFMLMWFDLENGMDTVFYHLINQQTRSIGGNVCFILVKELKNFNKYCEKIKISQCT